MKTLYLLVIVSAIALSVMSIASTNAYAVHPLPVPVLSMQSNTIGHIYVKFSTYYHNQTLQLGPMDIYDANLTNRNPLKLDDLSVIPNRASITLNSNSTIIDYTVTVKNSLKGIYALPIEHLSDLSPYVIGENPLKIYQERYSKSYCHMFPLVIGLNSSQIKEEALDKFVSLNASDNCPVSLTDQVFVGSNIIDRLPETIRRSTMPMMSITASFDKEAYFPGDLVMINGQIYTNDTKVTVELEKNHKLIVKSTDVPITQNGTFISNFTIPKDSAKTWSVVIVSSNGGTLTLDPNFESFPLKQFQSGIVAKDVICKQGLQLVYKSEDETPACVKPDTVNILAQRGWAIMSDLSLTNNMSESACGKFFTVPGNQNYSNTVPVLLMNSNSTACVKLTFTIISDYKDCNGQSCPHLLESTLPIGNLHYEKHGSMFSVSAGKDYTNSFKITAIPETIDLANYPVGANFTVTYIIRPLPNTTGFYDQSIPRLACERYPLAVGYTADQVNASDFSYIDPFNPPCGIGSYGLTGVEISGMSYKEVTLRLATLG